MTKLKKFHSKKTRHKLHNQELSSLSVLISKKTESWARISSKNPDLRSTSNCDIATCDQAGSTRLRCLLGFLSLLIYGNSLNCGFVYDDRPAILENRNVIHTGSWLTLWTDDFWGNPLHSASSHKSYRPLVTLSYKLQWSLGDSFTSMMQIQSEESYVKLQAISFHLFNVLLHLVIVDQVYLLLRWFLVMRHNSGSSQSVIGEGRKLARGMGDDSFIALLGGLLFACHPIHVEAVTSLVGRAELMGTLSCLLSFRYLIGHLAGRKREITGNLCLSILLLWFAFLSKENCALSGLLLNLAGVIFTFRSSEPSQAYSSRKQDGRLNRNSNDNNYNYNSNYKTIRTLAWPLIGLLASLFVWIAIRLLAMLASFALDQSPASDSWTLGPKFSHLDNPLAQSEHQYCLRNYAPKLARLAREQEVERGGGGSPSIRDFQEGEIDFNEGCSSEKLKAHLRRAMLMTRLYLPLASIRLLVLPWPLSYDWTLESLGGLIEWPSDMRFVAASGTWLFIACCLWKFLSTLGSFLTHFLFDVKQMVWPELTRGFDQLTASASYLDGNQNNNNNNYEHQTEADELDEAASTGSDCDSVQSMATTKTSDSGFNDYYDRSSNSSSPGPLDGSARQHQFVSLEQLGGRGGERAPCATLGPIGWSLCWLLIPLLPGSNLLWPVGFLLAERTLYMASIGFCLLMASLASRALSSCGGHLLALACCCDSNNSNQLQRDQASNETRRPLADRAISWFLASSLLLLLALGSTGIVIRNADWRNEPSLFRSNMAQSGPRSMSNLAVHLASNRDMPGSSTWSGPEVLDLYQAALELEPHSADLHYNLALALASAANNQAAWVPEGDRQQPLTGSNWSPGTTTTTTTSDDRRRHERIRHHYELALKLRPNFGLAALNLAAELAAEQPERAMRLLLQCGLKMGPHSSASGRSLTRQRKVQLECLVSALKLCLHKRDDDPLTKEEKRIPLDDDAGSLKPLSAIQRQQQLDYRFVPELPARPAKENKPNSSAARIKNNVDLSAAAGPAHLFKANQLLDPACLQMASPSSCACNQLDWTQIGLQLARGFHGESWASSRRVSNWLHRDHLATTDTSKQLAQIHWLQSKILLLNPNGAEPGSDRRLRSSLEAAARFASESAFPMPAELYLDYLASMSKDGGSHRRTEVTQELEYFIRAEKSKRVASGGQEVAKLYAKLAKLTPSPAEARRALEEARALQPDEPELAAELAHQAYLAGRLDRSEELYREAHLLERGRLGRKLARAKDQELLIMSDLDRRRLVKTHTNLGAILQLRNRKSEAKLQFEEAARLVEQSNWPKGDQTRRIVELNLRNLAA